MVVDINLHYNNRKEKSKKALIQKHCLYNNLSDYF